MLIGPQTSHHKTTTTATNARSAAATTSAVCVGISETEQDRRPEIAARIAPCRRPSRHRSITARGFVSGPSVAVWCVRVAVDRLSAGEITAIRVHETCTNRWDTRPAVPDIVRLRDLWRGRPLG